MVKLRQTLFCTLKLGMFEPRSFDFLSFNTSFSDPEKRKDQLYSIQVGGFKLIYAMFLKETSQESVNGNK